MADQAPFRRPKILEMPASVAWLRQSLRESPVRIPLADCRLPTQLPTCAYLVADLLPTCCQQQRLFEQELKTINYYFG